MTVREIATAAKIPLLTAVIAFSLFAFMLMGMDKARAKAHQRRISERTLLLFAAFFGGIGAFLGMEFFNHKTKKPPFPVLLPLFALLQSALLIAAFALSGTV